MYQNYDQVVADEEARIRGDQQCATVNAPVVTGYMFQQGHPVGVPAVGGTAPVAHPMGGPQMVPPGWQVVPTTTAPGWSGMPQGMPQGPGMSQGPGITQGSGIPQAPGQLYYVMVQAPCPPGQQQAAAPNQQMSFSSGGIAYMPYYPGVQPQLMAGQPVVSPSSTAQATTAESASTKVSPDHMTAADAHLPRVSPEHDSQAKEAIPTSRESPQKVHGSQTEVAFAEAKPGESVHASEVVAPEKERVHHHKQHHTSPKSKMSSESKSPSDDGSE
ncbi:hypothetical protein HPB51_017470 [Rhipicephalus microplus]|uniref:Uncharacterized protein n=1 Tax=Rhipicephalus microplus TaxID=6941 RepID=A0A9J6F562_RHIMP|nr:hypothetical protein HPB51_017470 [Rhipicephalus microplus]